MNPDRMIALHLALLDELGWKPPTASGDGLDDLRNGGFLTTAQAATICEVSDQAIRDWIDHAASINQPIAEKLTTWIISTRRLFAYIEAHCGGFPARVKAQNRWKDCWLQWSQSQEIAH